MARHSRHVTLIVEGYALPSLSQPYRNNHLIPNPLKASSQTFTPSQNHNTPHQQDLQSTLQQCLGKLQSNCPSFHPNPERPSSPALLYLPHNAKADQRSIHPSPLTALCFSYTAGPSTARTASLITSECSRKMTGKGCGTRSVICLQTDLPACPLIHLPIYLPYPSIHSYICTHEEKSIGA